MQLGLFGVVESDAHGQQLPAPRAQGSDAAGGQPAASPLALGGTGFQPVEVAESAASRVAWASILRLTQPDRQDFHRFLRARDAAFADGTKLLRLLNEWDSKRETAVTA